MEISSEFFSLGKNIIENDKDIYWLVRWLVEFFVFIYDFNCFFLHFLCIYFNSLFNYWLYSYVIAPKIVRLGVFCWMTSYVLNKFQICEYICIFTRKNYFFPLLTKKKYKTSKYFNLKVKFICFLFLQQMHKNLFILHISTNV